VVKPAFRSLLTVVLATPFRIPGSSTSVKLSLLDANSGFRDIRGT